jgi:hypothetical protein
MIPTTGNFKTFLSSVDADVTSILLAKQLVVKARNAKDNASIIKGLYLL